MLEMMYFCAELVQLIVGWSGSELEVHRCGMKKNSLESLSIDPIMLEDELLITAIWVVTLTVVLWAQHVFSSSVL